MGIFGLLSFMSKECENGFQEVRLKDIARQYKEQTGKDPVMLVDASSFVRFIATKGVPQKIPVTLLALQENLKIFIDKCSQMGIRLIFIADGLRPLEKYEKWIQNTLERYEKKNLYPDFLVGPLLSTAETIYQTSDKCEFVRSICEADNDIMRYAKTEGCFAIMSNDSDLLIAEGSYYFLSEPKLDLKTMSTYNFNRNSLAKYLGLRPSLLPVFASLCDSQIGGKEFLSKKDSVLKDPNVISKKFQEVAKTINASPFLKGDCEEILNHITEKMAPEEGNKVQNKFRFYSAAEKEVSVLMGNDHWNEILRTAERRHVTGVSDKHILEILRNRVVFLAPKYVCLDINMVQRLRPLRKKMYGILFSQCPDNEVCVTEYTFIREGKTVKPEIVEVQFERLSHCGVLQLWSQNCSVENMRERRRLFCETLDEKLTPAILDELNISEELLFPVLAMFYVRRDADSKKLDIEREILLWQTVLARKIPKRGFPRFSFVNPKELKLAEPFLTTIEHLQLLNSICGEPYSKVKTSLSNYYDGDVFHYAYQKVVNDKEISPDCRKGYRNSDQVQFYYYLKNKLETLESACGCIFSNLACSLG